jgi:hypothetical protein
MVGVPKAVFANMWADYKQANQAYEVGNYTESIKKFTPLVETFVQEKDYGTLK